MSVIGIYSCTVFVREKALRWGWSSVSDPEKAVVSLLIQRLSWWNSVCLDQTITREDKGHLGIRDGHVETICAAKMCRSAMACWGVRWQNQGMSSEPAEYWTCVTVVPSLLFPIKNGDRLYVFKERSKSFTRGLNSNTSCSCVHIYTLHILNNILDRLPWVKSSKICKQMS